MDREIAGLLVDFVEKVALLRRDMKQKKETPRQQEPDLDPLELLLDPN